MQTELKKSEQITKESNTGVIILKWKDKQAVLIQGTVCREKRKGVCTRGGITEETEMISDYHNYKTQNKMVLEVGS